MSQYHTDEQVRNYDIFKGVVAALLLVTLILSYLLGSGGDGGAQETASGIEGYPAAGEAAEAGTEGYPAAGEAAEAGSEGYPAGDETAAAGDEAYPGEDGQEPEASAPSLLSPSPESAPEPGVQTFSGMAMPGTELIVMADGTELGRTTVSENGTWEMEVDLPQGADTIQLQALDSDGSVIAASEDIYMTTEAAQAAAAEDAEGAEEAYPGDSEEDQAAEEDAPELESTDPPIVEQPGSPVPAFNPLTGSVALGGASAAGATIAAIVDDAIIAQAEAGDDGQWQLNLDLEPGTYDLAFGQVDEDGNVTSQSEPVSINVPAEMPQLDLPPYSLPDEALAAGSGADAATETAAAQALDSIDLPEIKLPAGPIEWTGSAAPGDEVAVVVDGEVAGTATAGEDGRFTLPGTLAAGLSTLQLALVGEDGELAATSKEIAAAIADIELPTIQLPRPAGDEDSIAISGTADPGSTVEITANGEKVAEAVAGADGAWAASLAAVAEAVSLRAQAIGEDGLPLLRSSPVQLPGGAAAVAEAPAESEAEAPAEGEAETPAEGESVTAVTGTVTYEEPILLPPGTVITVQIRDISRPGSTAIVMGEQLIKVEGQYVPIPYEVAYDAAEIDERFTYSMRARIEGDDGNLYFTNDSAIPVITNGNPTTDVEIMTVPVRSAESDAALGQAEVDLEVDADSAVEATEESGSFSILLDGLEQAGLTETLANADGAYTLFAPTDEAFESLPPGILAGWNAYPELFSDILRNLVVEGTYPPETLTDGIVLRSVAGTNIGITRDGKMLYINGVPVVDAAEAGDSIVYALPQVILPPLPAGISAPIVDQSGVPYFIGDVLTVVGRAEPGMRIVLAVDEQRFGDIAMIDPNGFWLASDEIGSGIHTIIAFMIDDRGLVQAISDEIILAVP